jgi:hypothetical protein
MRAPLVLALVALGAAASPPVVPDFVRIRGLRDGVESRIRQLAAEEDYAKKPDEEKMLIAFDGGKPFGKTAITGELVVRTVLKWADVQKDPPTDAGKRVLALLPQVLGRRYGAGVIDIPKDRYKVGKLLLEGLDSDYHLIRAASIDAIMKVYRKMDAQMYEATMATKKERAEAIGKWLKTVNKMK